MRPNANAPTSWPWTNCHDPMPKGRGFRRGDLVIRQGFVEVLVFEPRDKVYDF